MPQVADLALARQARRKPSHNREQQSFTSWKLDLIDCLLADPRLSAPAKLVAVCILQHVNNKSRRAWPSIETISDATCIGVRHVQRAIKTLQETGWLIVTRKNRHVANVYAFSEANVSKMLDRLTILREGRAVERKRKRARIPDTTRESSQKGSDTTRESSLETTPESSKHLRRTPKQYSDSQ